MKIATTAQMKELDRIAIEERRIPSLALMETAATRVTTAVLEAVRDLDWPHVLVVCGTGNNGGDGLACARQLLAEGIPVTTVLVGNPAHQTPDSRANTQRLLEAEGELYAFDGTLPEADCIVDALFGVGLNREVGGAYRDAIVQINASGCPVIACDIPSGIHGDTGAVMGEAVYAALTVTFTCAKPGLLAEPGKTHTGQLLVADIGIPKDLLDAL